jgi:hypothetical protein
VSREIVNTHDQLVAAVNAGTIQKDQAISVSYRARPGEVSKAVVGSPYFKTDEDAHWMDYGRKTFSAHFNGGWRKSIEVAKEWATETYGISEWARNRVGDWVPAIVNKKHPIPKPPPALDPTQPSLGASGH